MHVEFVRIPSLSPLYDPDWQTNGNLFKQCDHLKAFVEGQTLRGCTITTLRDAGRTPFLIVNVEPSEPAATRETCVLMYGHMDKQPFGEGWTTDPCDPVIKDGKMWGRGSVDDGYALFSAVLAIKACQVNGLSHPRCVITIEGSEEGEM
jgi:acetylornithine deacetylase/succinyl-diaminopimelate desuccinylase-like protein